MRTSRVVLRQWRQTDATAVWTLLSDQLSDLGALSPGPQEIEHGVTSHLGDPHVARNDTHPTDWVYAIRYPESEDAIGFVGLHRRGADGLELGYWLMSSSRGHGHTTESVRAVLQVCFAQPGLEHVQICCDPTNEPSIAVARRLGFYRDERPTSETEDEARTALMDWKPCAKLTVAVSRA
ncbi:MAG: GNAT family N-acetyltransferase [Gemmatimonadaceae bacterium]